MTNNLLRTDCYKFSHMTMYCPGTTKVYSYLTARSNKKFSEVVFFGLQYYLLKYLSKPVTRENAEEFIEVASAILGQPVTDDVRQKIRELSQLGYWPLQIKAVPEGTVVPIQNVLMTITNTDDKFAWCVGFVESLLLKIWYTCTVATQCLEYRKVVEQAFSETVDDNRRGNIPFIVHDFGYRGDTSEGGAGISGVAHLLSFLGSDTVLAYKVAKDYYGAVDPIMMSVPASEHSVMCSYGRENEFDAFKNILDVHPSGIVSIVSDTFDIWKVLTDILPRLKTQILSRDGVTVIRPDSGNPPDIICGNPLALPGSPEEKGCLRLLDEKFGHIINSKGYKVLNDKVRLIYGDGMYLERYKATLARMKTMGYAAENLIIGVGGILRNHSRDTLGFAIKATYVEVNGESREIEKDPITDPGKKSLKGLLRLCKDANGNYFTEQGVDRLTESSHSLLTTYFYNGVIFRKDTLAEIRKRIDEYISKQNHSST